MDPRQVVALAQKQYSLATGLTSPTYSWNYNDIRWSTSYNPTTDKYTVNLKDLTPSYNVNDVFSNVDAWMEEKWRQLVEGASIVGKETASGATENLWSTLSAPVLAIGIIAFGLLFAGKRGWI